MLSVGVLEIYRKVVSGCILCIKVVRLRSRLIAASSLPMLAGRGAQAEVGGARRLMNAGSSIDGSGTDAPDGVDFGNL